MVRNAGRIRLGFAAEMNTTNAYHIVFDPLCQYKAYGFWELGIILTHPHGTVARRYLDAKLARYNRHQYQQSHAPPAAVVALIGEACPSYANSWRSAMQILDEKPHLDNIGNAKMHFLTKSKTIGKKTEVVNRHYLAVSQEIW